MECKKDEAVRSREIAEQMFLQHDLAGAKKFALKAQHLFPDLEGLPQLIAVLDVYMMAQDKVNGVEHNWYAILQTDSTADDATIRKQYRKLALVLHPDKNKAIGAEGAFKLLSEAWGVLSDKMKKSAHDARRRSDSGWKSPKTKGAAGNSNGFYHFSRSRNWTQPKPAKQSYTFWTACSFCKTQLEYLRLYENQKLPCPSCHKPFIATEVPAVGGDATWHAPEQHSFGRKAGSSHHQVNGASLKPFCNLQLSGGTCRTTPSAAVAATAEMVRQTYETVQRERIRAQKEAREKARKERVKVQKEAMKKEHREREHRRRERGLERKWKVAAQAREVRDGLLARESEQQSSPEQLANELKKECEPTNSFRTERRSNASDCCLPREVLKEGGETIKFQKDPRRCEHINEVEVQVSETSSFQLPNAFKDALGCKRSAEFASGHDSQDAKKPRIHVQEPSFLGGKNRGVSAFEFDTRNINLRGSEEHKLNGFCTIEGVVIQGKDWTCTQTLDHASIGDAGHIPKYHPCENSRAVWSKLSTDVDNIYVPDSEFNDFDKDRTELHFSVGQVWAVYDDDDGMPRYYSQISEIVSVKPFRIHMSWLDACSPSKDISSWLNSGFSSSCGEYKLGESTVTEHVNIFSHQVSCVKGQSSTFMIYPKRGEIWALYKDWPVRLKAADAKHKYEMVAIVMDFMEERGMSIVPLVKVEGFKTVFQQARTIQHTKDLPRFSHQIPAHALTAGKTLGVLGGFWELDPASIPVDLT